MSRLVKTLYILLWTLIALSIVPVLILWAATLWLTPERFTEMVNRRASESMSLDIRCCNADYTIWSTFPDFVITMDSISIAGRNLRDMSPEQRKRLPADPDLILSAADVSAGIDIRDIFDNEEICLTGVSALSPFVNLVEVSDSLANYRIGTFSEKRNIPRIVVDSVVFRGKPRIAYHSVPRDEDFNASFDRLALRGRGTDQYSIDVKGRASFRSGMEVIFANFPFGIKGRVALGFVPLALSAENLRVVAGNVPMNLAADMSFGETPLLKSCGLRIGEFDVARLMGMFPADIIPDKVKAFEPAVRMYAMVRLSEPYRLDSGRMPSVEVNAAVPCGKMKYSAGGSDLSLDSICLLASADIDGRNPAASLLRIENMDLSGEGISVKGRADVSGLTRSPQIAAVLDADADIARMLSIVRSLTGNLLPDIAGRALIGADVRLRVIDMKNVDVENITADIYAEIPSFSMGRDGFRAGAKDVRAKGRVRFNPADSLPGEFRIDITGRSADYSERGLSVSLGDIAVKLSGTRLAGPLSPHLFEVPARWTADNACMDFAGHSPAFIISPMPYVLGGLMSEWQAAADVTLARGTVRSTAFPADNVLSDTHLSLSLDSLNIARATLKSGRSAVRVRGTVANLRQFINAAGPVPLPVTLVMDIDTLDCNELARVYVAGLRAARGEKAVEALAGPQPLTASDTIAMLLPRNVRADVRISAGRLLYLDIPLTGIKGDLSLRDGRLSADTVTARSPFGDIGLDFLFDTSDLQRMQVGASVSVSDIKTENIYRAFAGKLAPYPAIRNFNGIFSVDFAGQAHFFPKMYFNIPSAAADLYVKGRSLHINRNEFIDKMAWRMLIPDHVALDTGDIDVHAVLRRNRVEVYPFDIEIPRYRLRMTGLNNLDGDLCYQLSVLESPFHIPFGVNITGTFDKPKVRLGGSRWNDAKASMVSSDPVDPWTRNMRQSLRQILKQAVYKAAVISE